MRFSALFSRLQCSGYEICHEGLGRVTMRDDFRGGAKTRDGQTSWTYDRASNGLGRLYMVKEQMSGFSRTHTYDSLGREREVTSKLGSETRYERTTYDGHGRVFQRFDASRTAADYTDFGVRHFYNARGHLARVGDARVRNGVSKTTYVAVEQTDAAGRVIKEQLGDGGLTRIHTHDGQTGRLRGILTQKLGGEKLQNLTMTWDVGGNLKSRNDEQHGLSEIFEYDELDRLEKHHVGTGPMEEITYDGYGHIRTRTGMGTYRYTKAHPGRLEQVAGSKYAYDANGNVTSGGGRRIGYTSYDLPTSIVQGSTASEFVYGPDRERLVRRDKSDGKLLRKTWHLSGVERIESADGSVEVKRYLAGGALETVAYDAEGEETGRRLDYLLTDHLGSVVAVVERTATPSGQYRWDVREERAFDPWGGCRDPATWKACGTKDVLPKDDGLTRRGFTGHETLAAIGLVHMNGRIYDPALGRFLQADPYVQSGSDLQGLNRYAYVLNNPLSAVDPSGHYVFRLAAAVLTAGAGPVTKIIAFTVAGFADAMVAGADFGQAVRSGMISGITAAAFSSLSANLPVAETFEDQLLHGASYGFVGGVTSVIGGGRFGHGFVSAGLGAGFGGPLVKRLVERGLSVAAARTIAATLIGGTSSAATGGKFANGAAWAAFSAAASEVVGNMIAKNKALRARFEKLIASAGPGRDVGGVVFHNADGAEISDDQAASSLSDLAMIFL